MIILVVLLKMQSKFLNSFSKYGNLYFRRTSVLVVNLDLTDNLFLFCLGNHQSTIAYPQDYCNPSVKISPVDVQACYNIVRPYGHY